MPNQSFFYGNPDLYAQQIQLQRQQMMANALMQQSQQPATPDNWNSMPIVPKLGIGGALSKLGQALAGGYLQNQMTGKQADLYGKQLQYLEQEATPHTLTQGDTTNAVEADGPPTPQAQQAASSAVGAQIPSQINPQGLDPHLVAQMLMTNPEQYLGQVQRVHFPTPDLLQYQQMHGDPSLLPAAANAQMQKQAMPSLEPGFHLVGGKVTFTPQPAANANATVAPDLSVANETPVPGASDVQGTNAAATSAGAAIGGQQSYTGQNGENITSFPTRIPTIVGGQPTDAGRVAHVGITPPELAGNTGQVSDMAQRHERLTAANSNSSNIVSYLQTIKQLALQANTGGLNEKLTFANNLLSQIGVSDRAKDAATANDLMDKYSSQITALLGGGGSGLSTDAGRSLLSVAYPGRHMQDKAIDEAADNLIGAQYQTQAKYKLLTPLRLSNNAAGYSAAEGAFDQAADPRVYQLQHMPPDQQAAFVQSLTPGVAAQIRASRQKLQNMGAL